MNAIYQIVRFNRDGSREPLGKPHTDRKLAQTLAHASHISDPKHDYGVVVGDKVIYRYGRYPE